jgi:hypothetical protein
MIRLLYLRYLAHCYRRQRDGLLAEQRGIEAALAINERDQARTEARIEEAMAERRLNRYRVTL